MQIFHCHQCTLKNTAEKPSSLSLFPSLSSTPVASAALAASSTSGWALLGLVLICFPPKSLICSCSSTQSSKCQSEARDLLGMCPPSKVRVNGRETLQLPALGSITNLRAELEVGALVGWEGL